VDCHNPAMHLLLSEGMEPADTSMPTRPRARRSKRKQGRPQKDKPAVGPDALIAATRELMKSIPPGEITRLDIARAAGVDPALIRYYFGDKSALLVAAVLRAGAELRERQARGYAEGTSTRDKIRRRIFILLETLYRDPSLHHLIIERIIHSKSKAARQLRHDLVYRTCDELAAVIEEGVAAGEFRRVDPRHLFLATVGACSFPMAERALFAELMGGPTSEADLRAYADFVSDVFLDGLVSHKQEKRARRPVS
jgi:TetR/AcrR family transcriptional regulator